MYGAYRAGGGMPGLEIGAAVLILAAAATAYRLMVGPRLTRFALLAVGLAIASSAWSLRPQLLTLFLLAAPGLAAGRRASRFHPAILSVVGQRARRGRPGRRGPGGGDRRGGSSLGADARAGRSGAGGQAGAGLPLAGLAVAATPLGFHIYRFVVASAARSYAVQIAEWFVLRPDSLYGLLFWGATFAFAALVLVRWRAVAAGSWSDWAVVAAALALMPLAIRSARNIGPFLTLAMPAASRALGPHFRFRFRRQPRPETPDHPGANLALLIGIGAAATAVSGWPVESSRWLWERSP